MAGGGIVAFAMKEAMDHQCWKPGHISRNGYREGRGSKGDFGKGQPGKGDNSGEGYTGKGFIDILPRAMRERGIMEDIGVVGGFVMNKWNVWVFKGLVQMRHRQKRR